jgi:Ca2+-binding EF-hand superfamily protein
MKRSLILLTAMLASTAAFAQSAAPRADESEHRGERYRERAEEKFSEADSTHDGSISQSEWQSASLRRASERYRKLDGNRDGKLRHEEMAAGRPLGRRGHGDHRERLRALDTDGDSQLSRAEIGDKMPRLAADFDQLDGNRDGKLSREEMRAGRERRQEQVR